MYAELWKHHVEDEYDLYLTRNVKLIEIMPKL